MSIEKLEGGMHCVTCDICGTQGDPHGTWAEARLSREPQGFVRRRVADDEWEDFCAGCVGHHREERA
jgi:hypothetical protein